LTNQAIIVVTTELWRRTVLRCSSLIEFILYLFCPHREKRQRSTLLYRWRLLKRRGKKWGSQKCSNSRSSWRTPRPVSFTLSVHMFLTGIGQG